MAKSNNSPAPKKKDALPQPVSNTSKEEAAAKEQVKAPINKVAVKTPEQVVDTTEPKKLTMFHDTDENGTPFVNYR